MENKYQIICPDGENSELFDSLDSAIAHAATDGTEEIVEIWGSPLCEECSPLSVCDVLLMVQDECPYEIELDAVTEEHTNALMEALEACWEDMSKDCIAGKPTGVKYVWEAGIGAWDCRYPR